MIKKQQLQVGDYIQSEHGTKAFVEKVLNDKVRIRIADKKDYILDNQLHHWSYLNPIKDNRIINSKTFAVRFKQFLTWIPEDWWMSQPHYYEEYEYMMYVANSLLNYQIQTATDEEEINYLKRLDLL